MKQNVPITQYKPNNSKFKECEISPSAVIRRFPVRRQNSAQGKIKAGQAQNAFAF